MIIIKDKGPELVETNSTLDVLKNNTPLAGASEGIILIKSKASFFNYYIYSVSVCFPFYGINNLLNMPTGVVPVTHVNQDDLNALSDLDDNDLGVKEIKQVNSMIILLFA